MDEISIPAPRRVSRGLRVLPLRALSDDRLAELAAGGDRRAFAAIYERYHQALYRYCRSILRSEEDARDALQNTMASALGALDGERRTISLKPWLYRVAHNEALSLLRRRRAGDTGLDAVGELPGTSGPDHDTRERLRELVADLQELPDQQRGALVMRELSGLGYREIGAVFGISVAAATQAVYDARRGLHELAAGRAMECEELRRLISANDRRSLRARKVRGHLRACGGCRAFQSAIAQRSNELSALAPALPASAAAGLLQGLLGGGAVGGGGGGGGLAGLIAGAGNAASASIAAKGVAVVAVAATVGAGTGEMSGRIKDSGVPAPVSRSAPAPGPANLTGAAPAYAAPQAPGSSKGGVEGRGRSKAHRRADRRPASDHPQKQSRAGRGRSSDPAGGARGVRRSPAAKGRKHAPVRPRDGAPRGQSRGRSTPPSRSRQPAEPKSLGPAGSRGKHPAVPRRGTAKAPTGTSPAPAPISAPALPEPGE